MGILWKCSLYRHVGVGNAEISATQSNLKFRFHTRFVKAWERSTSIRGRELGRGQIPSVQFTN